MSKKNIFTLSFAVLFLALGIFFWNKKSPVLAGGEQNESFKKVFSESVRSSEVAKIKDSSVPDECHAFFEKVETTPYSALIHDFADGVVKLNPDCEKFEPQFLSNFLAEVYANCSKPLPWSDSVKQACGQAMVSYRALRLYQYNKDRKVKDLRNEELIQNIIALISSSAISSPEGAAELLANAMELKERWPDSAPAAKSVALAEFLSMNGNFRDPATNNVDRVLAAVEDARRLDSKDWQTFELETFLKHQQNPDQSFGDIARFAAQNPQSPIAFYYLGWALWNQQNAQGAKGALDKALSLDPNNSRFQETRRKMDTASFSDPIFSIQVGIGFDDL